MYWETFTVLSLSSLGCELVCGGSGHVLFVRLGKLFDREEELRKEERMEDERRKWLKK